MPMKMKLEFKEVSVTKSGDYYQVLFHDDLDTDDEPYFMIQRQFEFPDGGVCTFESHIEILIDQCKAKSLILTSNELSVSYGGNPENHIVVSFGASKGVLHELAETLKEMIPTAHINLENKC